MKFIGTRTVHISAIKRPIDWIERIGSDRVKHIAESFSLLGMSGPLQRTAITPAMDIVWGRDRLAAVFVQGSKEVEVDLWEGTPEELAIAERVENAHRRHSGEERDLALSELVDLLEPTSTPTASERGPAPTPRGEARKRVAQLTGLSPGAVAAADRRAKQPDEPAEPPQENQDFPTASIPVPPPETFSFVTFGLEVPDAVNRSMCDQAEAVDAAVAQLAQALRDWSAIKPSEASPGHTRWKRAKDRLLEASRFMESQKPWGVCPGCKLGPLRNQCPMCLTLRYIVFDQVQHIDPRLLDTDRLQALDGAGGIIPLEEVSLSRIPGKKIEVELG